MLSRGNKFRSLDLIAWISIIMMLISLPAVASDIVLDIFGNANMDEFVDENDITYLQGIIKGTNEPTKLADANNDSSIDESDISEIERIIAGNETQLTIIDSADQTITVKMPVDRVVAFNT